jgi:hypothetical protein
VPRCTGRTKARKRCKRPALNGTKRCASHPDPRAKPVAELVADDGLVRLASREASVMGSPLEISPQDAILECIRIAAGEVAYASERIAELRAEMALAPVKRSMVRKKGSETTAEQRSDPPALHKWILVRQQAMDRLTEYSQVALTLKLAIPIKTKDGIDEIKEQRAKRRARSAAT